MTTEIAVKEKPILFSGPMVRAILEGRKTVTRRVLKEEVKNCPMRFTSSGEGWGPIPANVFTPESNSGKVGIFTPQFVKCPYGAVGDRLWVRESWQAWTEYSKTKAEDIPAEARLNLNYPANGNTWDARLRPSIHMPRWASRITLEIADIRVERLNAISCQDAEAEGIEVLGKTAQGSTIYRDYLSPDSRECIHPKMSFMTLWQSINGTRPGCTWNDNPWVFAISFKRLEPTP